MTSTRKPRVAVLFGGRSSEHAVSCVTAAGVLDAIDRNKYNVVPIGIAKNGQWSLVSGDPAQWSLRSEVLPEVLASPETVSISTVVLGADAPATAPATAPAGEPAAAQVSESAAESPRDAAAQPVQSAAEPTSAASSGRELMVTAPDKLPRSLGGVDVVLPLLHGSFGEDGTLQGMLEMADVRYVGAGVLASAVGMDKHYMKVVFQAAGLTVGPYEVITDRQWQNADAACLERAGRLAFPVFVKPARAGSSMGISRVVSPDGLRSAVEKARALDPKVVIEAGIAGREIEVAVLQGRNNGDPRTSLPGEVDVQDNSHEWYDFEAKYVDGTAAKLSCPADLPPHTSERVRELAAAGFEAVGAEGLSRVDFFYTPAGELIINEINTMPGFTPISMYPQMWAKSGLPYPELIDELIYLALHRKTGLR